MQVKPVDLKSLGVDPLRGKAKQGTGWPENNRDKNWDWLYYCTCCHLEILKPYICTTERTLNKSIYSPQTPNWVLNRPQSLRPRCPACRELEHLLTKQQRIDYFKQNIGAIHHECSRLHHFQKKWKKFRRNHYDLLFNNSNLTINRDSLPYKPHDMWQCHLNILSYIQDTAGSMMPRSESTKDDLKLVWELDHKWRSARKQNEAANLMLNSAQHELKHTKNYARALDYYNRAIQARIDRSDLYLERAALFFQTAQYEKCVIDCTLVILMIDAVHTSQRESGAYVQAYYLRAKAYKFLSKLSEAESDLQAALAVDDEELDCKKLLNEIRTLLLLAKHTEAAAEDSKGEHDGQEEVIVVAAVKFLASAKDKTAEAELKLFSSLSDTFSAHNALLRSFVVTHKGFALCLGYLRSKFKCCSTKRATKELSKPGLDVLVGLINDMFALQEETDLDACVPLLCTNILYVFTLYFYLNHALRTQCLALATSAIRLPVVKAAMVAEKRLEPFMQRLRKLTSKLHKSKNVCEQEESRILQCMMLFDETYSADLNEKIANMYNSNEMYYMWLCRYVKCESSRENAIQSANGVLFVLRFVSDKSFWIYSGEDARENTLNAFFEWLDKLTTEGMIDYKLGWHIVCALSELEHGRKYLLDHEQWFAVFRVYGLRFEKGETVYALFVKLLQQEQDSREESEFNEEQAKLRRAFDEKETKREQRMKAKQQADEEKQSEDKKESDKEVDNDSDSSEEDYDEYLERLTEETYKNNADNQNKKRKEFKRKTWTPKEFVPQWEPVQVDNGAMMATHMKRVFTDKLSGQELEQIAAMHKSKQDQK